MTHGYGKSGIFDIVVCYKGRFIGIECKADATKKMTPLQVKNFNDAKETGAISLLIHKDNINELESTLEGIDFYESNT